MADDSGKDVWAWVGKIGTALAAVLLIIQLMDRFSTPEYAVRATGSYADFILPQEAKKIIERTRVNIQESAFRAPTRDSVRPSVRISAPVVGSDSILYQVLSSTSRAKTLWVISVQNTGRKELTNISLDMPSAGAYAMRPGDAIDIFSFFRYSEDAKIPSLTLFEGGINLGTLRPSNEVSVIVWSHDVATEWETRKIRVSHANGATSVKFGREVTGILAWLADYGEFILMLLLLIIPAISLGFLADRLKARPRDSLESGSEQMQGGDRPDPSKPD